MTPAQRKFTAKRFLGMLESGNMQQGQACPFRRRFAFWENGIKNHAMFYYCPLCREAIFSSDSHEYRCPCCVLGQEATKRAWLFIEESGILEDL